MIGNGYRLGRKTSGRTTEDSCCSARARERESERVSERETQGEKKTMLLPEEEEGISVSIRVRPLNEREEKQNQVCSWDVDTRNKKMTQLDDDQRRIKGSSYTYDQLFDENVIQNKN